MLNAAYNDGADVGRFRTEDGRKLIGERTDATNDGRTDVTNGGLTCGITGGLTHKLRD